MGIISQAFNYSLLPAATVLIGGFVALVKTPSKAASSFTQHFAAGVVFAAVALELLPKLSQLHNNWALLLGFVFGVGFMLMVKAITADHGHKDENDHCQALPWSMIIAVTVDLFIDGLLIGISLIAGEQGGLLVAIALGIEILFLSVAVTSSLMQKKISKLLSLTLLIVMAVLILLGAILGSYLITQSNDFVIEAVLAFGVAALMYLIVEELIEEAHEIQDTPVITSAFFIGFLSIYLLNQQI